GEVTGSDLLVLHKDRVLVANRMPITHNNQQLGWVVTFQDRTESETLKRSLDEVTGLADTLRAQAREFANRLHTLGGLVELGHYAEAVEFVTGLVAAEPDLLIRVRDSGPGVAPELRDQIFTDGVPTKSSLTGARRGLRLALV